MSQYAASATRQSRNATGSVAGSNSAAAFDSNETNGRNPATQYYDPSSMLLMTPSHTSPDMCDSHGREPSSTAAVTFNANPIYPSRSSAFIVDSDSLSGELTGPQGTERSPDLYRRPDATELRVPMQNQSHQRSLTNERALTSPPTTISAAGGEKEDGTRLVTDEEGVIPLHKVNWEHHGPWSWVSVCSRPGLRWVCARTHSDDFVDIANGLTKTWSRRLKMQGFTPQRARMADPDRATAWSYAQAYFERSYDACFGVVHRPSFEARLQAHFDHQGQAPDDPSWFALRNMVYAAGCRCMLARQPEISFAQGDTQVSLFFQRALSVFSEIILGHSGFTAVQALVLMAFYAEGLGSPALEYPLCTNAVQLAQAKGLHRAPSKFWGLAEADILNRSWLWWAIYCLEKQIAFRGGRPSVIDDDNISTPIPTTAPPGSTIDVGVFTLIIQHAQISAQISRRIMSVKAFKESSGEVIETVRDIQVQLERLLESVPPDLRATNVLRYDFPLSPRQIHILYLHFAIYGSLMATNIIFFYPWITSRFGKGADVAFQDQVAESSETIAHAARQILRLLRSVTTDLSIPAWLAFYYPMYAHINLFVYILKNPQLSTTAADLALLDICAGHFGHIELVTESEISFHFPRESAALCSRAIKAVKGLERENRTVPATPQPTNAPTREDARLDSTFLCGEQSILGDDELDHDPFDAMNLDIESWNIFSSIDITDTFGMGFDNFD